MKKTFDLVAVPTKVGKDNAHVPFLVLYIVLRYIISPTMLVSSLSSIPLASAGSTPITAPLVALLVADVDVKVVVGVFHGAWITSIFGGATQRPYATTSAHA